MTTSASPNQFTVITSIATSGQDGGLQSVYQDVYDFHQMLAKKYSVVGNIPPAPSKPNYKVAVSSGKLFSAPDVNSTVLGYAVMGDLLYGTSTQNGLLSTTRGWIRTTQVSPT